MSATKICNKFTKESLNCLVLVIHHHLHHTDNEKTFMMYKFSIFPTQLQRFTAAGCKKNFGNCDEAVFVLQFFSNY